MPLPKMPLQKWSKTMQDLYDDEVVQVVYDHNNTRRADRIWLGHRSNFISNEILEKGRADFSVGYDHDDFPLTPHEKTLLYCFNNMRLHFFEALATFKRYATTIRSLFADGSRTLS